MTNTEASDPGVGDGSGEPTEESPSWLPPIGEPPEPRAHSPKLQLTETMRGWATSAYPDDPVNGGRLGREANVKMGFTVHTTVTDLEALLADPSTPARLDGKVYADTISPEPTTILDGRFQLFATNPLTAAAAMMRYSMTLAAADDKLYKLEGVKHLEDDPGFDMWSDTTTLDLTIYDEDGTALASGQAHIGPLGVLRMAASVRIRDGGWPWRRLALRFKFHRLFLTTLLDRYGKLFAQVAEFHEAAETPAPVPDRTLPEFDHWWCVGEKPPFGAEKFDPEWVDAKTHSDKQGKAPPEAWLSLKRFNGRKGNAAKGPVMLSPGFGMSTEHFLLDTTAQNLVEFLLDNDYDVWLFDYRAGTNLPSSKTDFTLDDIARVDWPTGVAKVLAESGKPSVQVVAHCVGSMTVQMAVLSGTQGVRTIVASQVTVHPVMAAFSRFKANIYLANVLDELGEHVLRRQDKPTPAARLLDFVMHFNPLLKGERCGSPVCRWIFGFYGPTHRHRNLNAATHARIPGLFGVASMKALEHIGLIVRKGHAVDADGVEKYLPHAERLAIPILFLAGRYNNIFRPASSVKTLEWLRSENDPSLYTRVVLEDYAHLDGIIGVRAHIDVFPAILEHLDAHQLPGPDLDLTQTQEASDEPEPKPEPDQNQDSAPIAMTD